MPYYYGTKDHRSNTVRYLIRFNEPVDGEALRKAVDTALVRYPYFKVKPVSNIFRTKLVPNDAPVVVKETDKAINLGGEESNGHLIAFSYSGNSLFINNFHGLCDGRGRGPFMKTLLYYYGKFRYDEDIQMEGVNLADSPIDPAESEDPFCKPLPKGGKMKLLLSPLKPMKLHKMGLVRTQRPQIRCIQLDEQRFIKWCKENDATPNTALSLLMARAVKKIHPDSQKSIVAGVCCDLRQALQAPKSHLSLVHFVHMKYDDKLAKMPFDQQCIVFRGQMLLTSDTDENLKYIHLYNILFHLSYYAPFKFIKRIMGNTVWDVMYGQNTFTTSYTGKVSYGTLDSHIRGLYSMPNAYKSGIMMEITCAGGHLIIAFAQEWENNVYFDAFCEELRAIGFEPRLAYSGALESGDFLD